MLYTLNSHNALYQLYLSKIGEKKTKTGEVDITKTNVRIQKKRIKEKKIKKKSSPKHK